MAKTAPTYLLIALFALSLGVVAARAPAFQGAAPVTGMSFAAAAQALFDRADYALARSWAATRRGDGDEATIWAERSLNAAPANAYAALALAWGQARRGEDAAARAALEQSYRLAPRSTPLAMSRAMLAQEWWPEMDEAARRRLLDEVRVARGFDAHAFNLSAEAVPRLAALHDLAMEMRRNEGPWGPPPTQSR